ncbi:MAG TPA: hypothetical protein DGG94_22765 [Micromonosporaceae bacterium]|nr:hypothetical protein [Micromonosporaceae bacterium]HCU52578.1 hypothetical protein [Micromonosporaceae bacterium]
MRFVRVTAVLALLFAGCASPKAKTEEPRETVSVRTLQLSNGPDRPLPTVVYQPSRAGKLPLVLFIHGYTCRPAEYDSLFRHWAAAGFVVAAPTMSRTARGSTDFLQWTLRGDASAKARLVALIGHDASA